MQWTPDTTSAVATWTGAGGVRLRRLREDGDLYLGHVGIEDWPVAFVFQASDDETALAEASQRFATLVPVGWKALGAEWVAAFGANQMRVFNVRCVDGLRWYVGDDTPRVEDLGAVADTVLAAVLARMSDRFGMTRAWTPAIVGGEPVVEDVHVAVRPEAIDEVIDEVIDETAAPVEPFDLSWWLGQAFNGMRDMDVDAAASILAGALVRGAYEDFAVRRALAAAVSELLNAGALNLTFGEPMDTREPLASDEEVARFLTTEERRA